MGKIIENTTISKKDGLAATAAIRPNPGTGNPFIEQTKTAIELAGCEVVPWKHLLANIPSSQKRYLILNWFDEPRGTPFVIAAKSIKRRLTIRWYRLQGVRVLFIVHNRYPHENQSGLAMSAARSLRASICRQCDAIIGLSHATENALKDLLPDWESSDYKEKYFVIPHPNYFGCYNDSSIDRINAFGYGDSFTFLLVGNIKRYKNIELILSVATEFESEQLDAKFVIAGRCDDQKYYQELNEAAPGNVEIIEGFVSEDDMSRYIKSADAMILPYDSSSLNSGVCILAFSLGRTVVCPKIGSLENVPDDLVFSYTYNNEQEHLDNLRNASRKAYITKQTDPQSYAELGHKLRDFIADNNSLEIVGEKYIEVFQSIENRRPHHR